MLCAAPSTRICVTRPAPQHSGPDLGNHPGAWNLHSNTPRGESRPRDVGSTATREDSRHSQTSVC